MATFRVRKVVTHEYETYIKADTFDEAEEIAMYDNNLEWEDNTDYGYNEEYDIDEEDE